MDRTCASSSPTLIAGAGWSGLAAAIKLVQAGHKVIVLESAKQAGGRARAVKTHDWTVDNGQHLLLGAYHNLYDLFSLIGVPINQQLSRRPLQLNYRGLQGPDFRIVAPILPAPLHMAWAIAQASGISKQERYSALRLALRLALTRFTLRHDVSVRDLLMRRGQSDATIRALWEPLCLGALNTHINQASARIFLRTLKDAFHRRRSDADLILYREDLSSLFVNPAIEYIQSHGGKVITGQRVLRVLAEENKVQGVITTAGEMACQQLILATPHTITARLCQEHRALAPITANLKRLTDEPIVTVYLQFPPEIRLPTDLIGVLDGVSQWIFDRSLNQQPGLMAVVISGDGAHMKLDNPALIEQVGQELSKLYPHWPAPDDATVIREKHATFCCTIDVDKLRPDNTTNIKGLWLAGDYTNTGYPATLEGAVQSGIQCAKQLLKAQGQSS